MSSAHKQAMEAVLVAARLDIQGMMDERGIDDAVGEDAESVIFDVAIMHAYRVFVRILEQEGFQGDAGFFADLASELAEDMASETD